MINKQDQIFFLKERKKKVHCVLLWLQFLKIWHKVYPPETFIEWS